MVGVLLEARIVVFLLLYLYGLLEQPAMGLRAPLQPHQLQLPAEREERSRQLSVLLLQGNLEEREA